MKSCESGVLIAGLGHLGSRYLQGLVSGKFNFQIDILEPSDASFERGFELAKSSMDLGCSDVSRVSMSSLGPCYSVCIVATSAAPRALLIEEIATNTDIKNWVLEKVLAQNEEQLAVILSAVKSSDGAWVNTPRRRTSIYRQLKLLLDTAVPITFHANYPAIGLGCNAIHFIDVVAWLVNSDVKEVNINSPEGWKPSKRQGYSEFDGQMDVSFMDGSVLHIDSDPQIPAGLTVKQGDREFSIDESKGVAEGSCFYPSRVEYQSELSFSLVRDILEGTMGDGLPSVQQSVQQHMKLFAAIRRCKTLHLDSNSGLPIT